MKLKTIVTIMLLGGLLWARAQVTPEEKQALQDLYNNTGGPNWTSESDAFQGDDWDFAGIVTSDWYGVTVANGHVVQLDLGSNGLEGNIPASIGDLVHLTLLDFFKNKLMGSLPIEIGNLNLLETLDLSGNDLNGNLPQSLASLANLTALYLTKNDFDGEIPPEIVDQLQLTDLQIGNNLFDFGDLEHTHQNFNGNDFTYAPQQKTDQPEVLQYVEGEDVALTTGISGTQNHYQWFKNGQPINGAPDSPEYHIVGANLQDAGTYHCEMTSDIVVGLTLIRHDMELTMGQNPEEPEAPEEDWNIITVWDYDMDTNLKGNTRRYYNDLGKQVQTQSWDFVTNTMWGQATLYDFQGRAALSTLSAPLPGQAEFQYHVAFITNEEGSTYDAVDFETSPFAPDEVLIDGPLGKYYSGITSHQYQDLTPHPFLRTIFSDLNPGAPLAMVGGNKVDTNNDNEITSEDTWPQAYSFTMPASSELTYPIAFKDEAYANIRTLKTVNRDVHGNETVVFTDTDGKLLATARSGEEGALSAPIQLHIGEQGYVDVHVPKGATGITVTNENAVTIYNLITENVEANTPKNLSPGFYRVAVNDLENYDPNTIYVTYRVNYYDYSLNEYDEAGRLVASYQPLTDGNGKKLVTTYEYNTLGQLIYVESPDEGTSQFKYRKDGQIRYSQNSEQAASNEASFTEYDSFGRPVKSGVITNVVFKNLDPDAPLPQQPMQEVVGTTYDFLNDADNLLLEDLEPEYRYPSFLAGNVAKTQNDHATTYYSYDAYGRVIWLLQYMEGLEGKKTINYEYEPHSGLVEKVIYQKNQQDQFMHLYTYNQRDQLTQVETSVDGAIFTLHAEYFYDNAGTLVRTEIADGAQGLDYVYTLAGQLKSINHPNLDAANDPGGDGNDLFGMQLDYHMGDYQRPENSNITTALPGTDQLNGNIKGIRWQTRTDDIEAGQYAFSYNRNNWLTGADFDPDGNTTDYDVGPITYDANGNIQSLERRKDLHLGKTTMDELTYHYDDQKPNQLKWVDDAIGDAPQADDLHDQEPDNYQYNSIGQLIYDDSQEISYIYNASGLVAEVEQNGHPLVKFFYNDRNHRVKKETYDNNGLLANTTFYVRDVAGQVMAVYNDAFGPMALVEQPMYGAGRVGIAYSDLNNQKTYVYQLTDHLGNVRAVFVKDNDDVNLEGYSDYYPFGMPMPNRTLLGPEGYRYAFQGQEKDPETGKEAFELRLWDSRIGRWLTTDPMGEFASPYLGMGNNPISRIDPTGGKTDDYYIHSDGTIEYIDTGNIDNYYYVGEGGETTLLGTFEKNSNGLIQLPNSYSLNVGDLSIGFKVKSGNDYRSYISGEGLASLFGALVETNTTDLTVVGFSLSNGSSPSPSVSHINGKNGDLRYLDSNFTGGRTLLQDDDFDYARQNTFNEALNKFGWTDMLSENFTRTTSSGFKYSTRPHYTRHYNRSRHNNHLHLQGYEPNLISGNPILYQRPLGPFVNPNMN